MGFNLRSGNSALAFKEMGSSPNKGLFGGEKKEEEAPDPALTRPSSTKFASPNKMDPSLLMGAMGSMGGMMGGGGGGGSKEPDKRGAFGSMGGT